MARGRERHSKASSSRKKDDDFEDDDIQALRKSGKASFNRDEAFEDSEDEFFAQRDQIMLDGSKPGVRRDADYMSASDEEMLPLEGLSDEPSEEEDDEEEISDGQDDDRSLIDEEEQEEEDMDKEAWGSSRKAYYGADDVSDEEDIAQEVQEAERLQKKHLARLRPEDFLDTWADVPISAETAQPGGQIVTEELPPQDLSKLSKADLLKLLKSRHPDVPRLASLYQRLHPQLPSLALLAQQSLHPQHTTIKLKHALLSVFLSSIAIYFAVRADERERSSTEKKLIAKIVETEALWNQVSTIPIDDNAPDRHVSDTTESKLDNLIDDVAPLQLSPPKQQVTLKRKRTKLKTLADDSDSDDDNDLAATLALLKKSRSKSTTAAEADLSDFADPTSLHPLDAQEKRQNKKTLRFYTSQIENKLAKRREKYAGDTEVFKERRNDRNERQIEDARKRGLASVVDDRALQQNDTDEDEEPTAVASTAPEDEYYDMIAARSARKKAKNGKEEYEAAKAAARAVLLGELEEADVDESGKRLITRQIEKNKGLMPHRNKDARNPRVKKRKMYAKKQQKLKGRQQVYQIGDRRRGAYGGEETGINKDVVKGVKLG